MMLCVILPILLIVGHSVGAGGFSFAYTGSRTKYTLLIKEVPLLFSTKYRTSK
jgi:hypothetical protein